jgi:hypothetical protein
LLSRRQDRFTRGRIVNGSFHFISRPLVYDPLVYDPLVYDPLIYDPSDLYISPGRGNRHLKTGAFELGPKLE